MRSGFASVVGRPNVGKSTLVNTIIGEKVTITSSRTNTTRHQIRGVLTRPGYQIVFVDTPGLHRPRTRLGERLNDSAIDAFSDVDVLIPLIEANQEVGLGDMAVMTRCLEVAARGGPSVLIAVNKIDAAGAAKTAEQLMVVHQALIELAAKRNELTRAVDAAEYFPISAKTGKGVGALVDAVVDRMDEGPPYYPSEMISDQAEATHIAELVREQLLSRTRDELPHSIFCQVTEWEGNRIRVEILVERDSQKGIVIGKGGEILKAVGIAARAQLPEHTHLELYVRVEKNWQSRAEVLDRLGL
jgi:GTP-binding protein Era